MHWDNVCVTIGVYNMAINLVEKSKVVEGKNEQRYTCPIAMTTKKPLNIIPPEKIIRCERRELGASSNCAICEGVDKETFGKCKNRWTDY